LGSDAFRVREEAAKELVLMGGQAYPFLQRATRHPDSEVAQRAVHVIKRIGEKTPLEQIRTKQEDFIQTSDFPVVGRIVNANCRVSSVHFGDISLKLCDLRTLYMRGSNSDADLTIDAARYGPAQDQWMETGITVDPSQRLYVTAEGLVDLWP